MLSWTYSTQAKPTDGMELQNSFNGKKQSGDSSMNIATVTKNTLEKKGLVGLDDPKERAQNREKSQKQALNKYMTRDFRTM